jgi:protein TonB
MKPVAPKPAVKRTPKPTPVAAPEDTTAAAQQTTSLEGLGSAAEATGLGGQAGPVRLTLGGNVQLLRKVVPAYPPSMQASHMEGEVVLDCVINRDGSIGDITVVRSSGLAFERAAITAVRQWRYTPIPDEGILTVTLNFTLPR